MDDRSSSSDSQASSAHSCELILDTLEDEAEESKDFWLRSDAQMRSLKVPAPAIKQLKEFSNRGHKLKATQHLSFAADETASAWKGDATFDCSLDLQPHSMGSKTTNSTLVPPFVLAGGDGSIRHGYHSLTGGSTSMNNHLNGSSLVERSPFLSGDEYIFELEQEVGQKQNLSRKLLKLHEGAVQFIPSKPGKSRQQSDHEFCYSDF